MNTLFYVVCIVAIVFTADTIQKYLKMKNQEKKSDPELEETLARESLLEFRIRFFFLVFHLQILLDGIRREYNCDDANDVEQRVH